MKILLAGGGYVGTALADRLIARQAEVWILKRTNALVPEGARHLPADLANENLEILLPPGLSAVVFTVSASEYSDEAYRRAYVSALRNTFRLLTSLPDFRGRFLFISSTSVYPQKDGEWVDEKSPASATHFSGSRLLEGEALVRSSGFESSVIRLGGIYGPGRTRLIREVQSGVGLSDGPPQYTNRIHRDDCAGIIEHLLRLPKIEPIYLGVDCDPAPRNEVVSWLASQLHLPQPVRQTAAVAEPLRGNKRCSNKLILESGYTFRYPTYREGYGALLLSAF